MQGFHSPKSLQSPQHMIRHKRASYLIRHWSARAGTRRVKISKSMFMSGMRQPSQMINSCYMRPFQQLCQRTKNITARINVGAVPGCSAGTLQRSRHISIWLSSQKRKHPVITGQSHILCSDHSIISCTMLLQSSLPRTVPQPVLYL